MSYSITSSQNALTLLTGQNKTSSVSQSTTTATAETKGARHRPPPPPKDQSGNAFSSQGAALAQSVFAALASNFDADQNGTLSASEIGSTSADDDAAKLFAALDGIGDGEMTSDELGNFLQTIADSTSADSIGAARPNSGQTNTAGGPPPNGPPPNGPPPSGGPPPEGGQDEISTAVSSLLEGLIAAQANANSAAMGQSTTSLIDQFTKLLAQVA
jgi:hypothetical protein